MDPSDTGVQARKTPVRRKRYRSLSRSISASLSRRILTRTSDAKVDFPSKSEPSILTTSISEQPTHSPKPFFPTSDEESESPLNSLTESQSRRKGSVVWRRTTVQSDNSIVKSVTVVEPKTKWSRTKFSLEHIDDLAFYLQLDKQQIDEIQTDIDQVRERQEAKRLSARFDKLQLDSLDEQIFEDRMEDILHKHSPLVRAKRSSVGHLRTHRSKSLNNTVDTPITKGLSHQAMWELCDLSDLKLLQELGRDRNTILWKAHIGQSAICAKQILDPMQERTEQLREHVRLMRQCAHPNLVTHYGVGLDQSTNQFFVFAELIEESLVDVINRHKAMSEGVAAIVIYQVLSALAHIHEQGFTHGALKPTKILINQNGVVKLSDFQALSEFREPLPRYTAPEILRGNVYLEVSDSWSVGCLLVYLLTGKAPYASMKSYELMSLLKGKQPFCPPMPPKIGADCASFLKLCWEQASERCNAATLVTHRFVRHACEDHQSVISYLRSKKSVASISFSGK